jgi:low temperature requirement protein LtrA
MTRAPRIGAGSLSGDPPNGYCEDERMSTTESTPRPRRMAAVLRDDERVTPLELFFDLVFVLAITQCTALMAAHPTWEGLAQGTLVLGMLWWAWVGYAWLTSTVDPEEGGVRLAMFAAMAALLVVALCVPGAFGSAGLEFAVAYVAVRAAQIVLLYRAGRDDPALRRAVITGLVGSTAIAGALLIAASYTDGALQLALWAVALVLDMSGPLFFGTEGWKLVPGHFAERHGLIVLIALGESIVAIGVGAGRTIDAGVVGAAVLGTIVAAGLWWTYFDVVAIVAARRLARTPVGRAQNAMARDSYSYLHLPMIVGIVLLALGMKKTLAHVEDPLKLVPGFALLGGVALYLLAHVAFRYRGGRTLSRRRLVMAIVLLTLVPVSVELPALATLGILAALLVGLIAYETHSYGEARDRVRHEIAREPNPD